MTRGHGDASIVSSAALCSYYCGDYEAAIGLAVEHGDDALAHRFYLFYDDASVAGLALRESAATKASATLGRTLVSRYDDVAWRDDDVLVANVAASSTLGIVGPNPILFDETTIYGGGRGEGTPYVPGCDGAVDGRDYDVSRGGAATAESVCVVVPASKPGNYYHCLLEYVGKVALLPPAARAILDGACFLVPRNQCLDLYAEALKALGVSHWRVFEPSTPLRLPRGCFVVDVVRVARTRSPGRDSDSEEAHKSMWDLYTPPSAVPRAVRDRLGDPLPLADATTAVLVVRGRGQRAFEDHARLLDRLKTWSRGRLTWTTFGDGDATTLAAQSAAFRAAALVVGAHGAGSEKGDVF